MHSSAKAYYGGQWVQGVFVKKLSSKLKGHLLDITAQYGIVKNHYGPSMPNGSWVTKRAIADVHKKGDDSTTSMEHSIPSPTTVIIRWSTGQHGVTKMDSQSGWLSRLMGKKATTGRLQILLEIKPLKLDRMPFAATILLLQPPIQFCYQYQSHKANWTLNKAGYWRTASRLAERS